MEPRSPLFPAASLAPGGDALLPQLPDQPTLHTSSYRAYVVTTEKHLFVQGFTAAEYEDRPPTLLRGCVVLHVLKSTKLIKSLSLLFKALLKTDWPEGIPPKKQLYAEHHDLVSHTWPFYQLDSPLPHCGADLYVPASRTGLHDDVLALNLADSAPQLAPMESAALFAANLVKRATLPDRLLPSSLRPDLAAVLSALSLSDDLRRVFAPGYYVFNFEHPIPPLLPETVNLTFGSVSYMLELTIARHGAFKPTLSAKVPIEVIRTPLENSVEENEPIIIERSWEEHMRYEIVVGSKAVVLDLYVPLNFRFIPLLSKVQLHRIRVYITENCNYYCSNKSVHRAEPVKKFLLLEHKAKKNQSLMSRSGGMADLPDPDDDEVLPRELEFQMFVPSVINKKYNYCMHPDTSYDHINCDHWLKISLRISRQDKENPAKRKHFEILIDSPIHLCSPLAAHSHTSLPSYDMEPEFLPIYSPNSPPMSPGVTPVDYSLQGVGRLLLFALASGGSTPPQHANDPIGQRSATPIEFHRIASADDNETPIERDLDMHLEANLYEPSDGEMLEALNSPQARPFSPPLRPNSPLFHPLSPVSSPLVAPTPSITRRPTVNPPSFGIPGVAQDILPPAYEVEDPALGLSPVRLDVSMSSKEGGFGDSGIKNLLSKQLDNRAKNSHSDRESIRSDQTARSSDKESIKTLHSRELDSRGRLNLKAGEIDSTRSFREHSAPKSSLVVLDDGLLGPLAKHQHIPTASVPSSRLSQETTYTKSEKDNASSVKDVEDKHGSTEGEDLVRPDVDLTDTMTHLGVEFSNKTKSRASSFSLLNSLALGLDDMPLDQTLPLLSMSSTSVLDGGQFLFDDHHGSFLGDPSMTDLTDARNFGNDQYRVAGSLSLLRNPRIKKHYQDSGTMAEREDLLEHGLKPRQKSFGVIPEFDFSVSEFKDDKQSSSDCSIDKVTSRNDGKTDSHIKQHDLQALLFNK